MKISVSKEKIVDVHHRDDLSGVQYTAEINCTPRNQNRNLNLSMVAFKETKEYLDEIETVFENTLACLSGAQMG